MVIGQPDCMGKRSEAVQTFLSYKGCISHQSPSKAGLSSRVRAPLWKRALDLGLIVLASPVALSVGVVIAAIIKLGSRGPVIFKQERLGYKGQRFTCYKFRTMRVGAETASHQGHMEQLMKSSAPMTKLDAKKDARVIPFGSVLRAMGLDELPQLINVVLGDMSLVGPRPCVQYEYDRYEAWQKRRFDAVPGLTGLWQVSGKNRLSFKQMMQLDIEYSEQASLWLDIWIILKTVPAIIEQCCDQRKKRRAARLTSIGSSSVNSAAGLPAEVNAMN